jgi:phosphoglycolate phosphatase-like HAD superfamily hydrolase
MSPIRRLILWDVDGTLISAGPAARVAFDLAVAQVIGRAPGDHDVHMSGKTDPQIAMEILATMALSERDARDSLPDVLKSLELELERAIDTIRRDGIVHPGVESVLARLDAAPEVVQTVLTGNLAANARLKLGAFGLDRWIDLDIAATGDDHHDRTELVPVALGKAEARFGHPFDPAETWVIGDTPRDLECARAGGARCLLVATGRFKLDALRTLGADAVLLNLSDADLVTRILLTPTLATDKLPQGELATEEPRGL